MSLVNVCQPPNITTIIDMFYLLRSIRFRCWPMWQRFIPTKNAWALEKSSAKKTKRSQMDVYSRNTTWATTNGVHSLMSKVRLQILDVDYVNLVKKHIKISSFLRKLELNGWLQRMDVSNKIFQLSPFMQHLAMKALFMVR